MTTEVWIITVLTGLVVNIATGWVTYLITARRDQARFLSESRQANARIADIAVHHLYGSYLANRRLRLDVLSDIGALRKGEAKGEVVVSILDGIARSLEQERISLIPNISTWKGFLDEGGEPFKLLLKLQREDFLAETPIEQAATKPTAPTQKLQPSPPRTDVRGGILGSLSRLAVRPGEELLRAVVAGDQQRLHDIAAGDTSRLRAEEKIILGSSLAIAGDPLATELLKSAYDQKAETSDKSSAHVIIGSLVTVAERNDTEREILPVVEPMVQKWAKREGATPQDRAWLLNQLQKLYWGAGEASRCIGMLEEIIQLQPQQSAYHHNLALCYRELGQHAQAATAIQKALDLGSQDPDHLSVAVRAYRAIGDAARADALLEKLRAADPFLAMLVGDTDVEEIAKTLGIQADPEEA